MTDEDLRDLPHAVVYEPSAGAERQRLVGPFGDLAAALAYIDGDNLVEKFDRAWALPLLPPAADAVYSMRPGPGLCMAGCGEASAWEVTAPDGASTELCDIHVKPCLEADGMQAVPKL